MGKHTNKNEAHKDGSESKRKKEDSTRRGSLSEEFSIHKDEMTAI